MRLALFSLVLSALVASSFAMAKEPETIADVENGKSTFLKQSGQIRRDLERSKKYRELGKHERIKVIEALGRMEHTMGGVASIDELNPQQRVTLYNDQELVNALLLEAREDSRQICRREKSVGSNMAQLRCETVAERSRRQARENAEVERLVNSRRPKLATE